MVGIGYPMIMCLIQGMNSDILAYTVGYPGIAQPMFQETIPTWKRKQQMQCSNAQTCIDKAVHAMHCVLFVEFVLVFSVHTFSCLTLTEFTFSMNSFSVEKNETASHCGELKRMLQRQRTGKGATTFMHGLCMAGIFPAQSPVYHCWDTGHLVCRHAHLDSAQSQLP